MAEREAADERLKHEVMAGLDSLPPERVRLVRELIAALQRPVRPHRRRRREAGSLLDGPAIGIWADQHDMGDPAESARTLRRMIEQRGDRGSHPR